MSLGSPNSSSSILMLNPYAFVFFFWETTSTEFCIFRSVTECDELNWSFGQFSQHVKLHLWGDRTVFGRSNNTGCYLYGKSHTSSLQRFLFSFARMHCVLWSFHFKTLVPTVSLPHRPSKTLCFVQSIE